MLLIITVIRGCLLCSADRVGRGSCYYLEVGPEFFLHRCKGFVYDISAQDGLAEELNSDMLDEHELYYRLHSRCLELTPVNAEISFDSGSFPICLNVE